MVEKYKKTSANISQLSGSSYETTKQPEQVKQKQDGGEIQENDKDGHKAGDSLGTDEKSKAV